jgi:hypothetical protein
MEREQLDYTIVMENGPHTEVLGRVRDLDFGAAVYTAAVTRFPKRNIQLCLGERVIKRHDGEPPKPPPVPVDPNMKTWSVHLIGGRKMESYGYVEAISEEAAIEAAVAKFRLDDQKRKRLAVNLTR